LDRPMLQMRPTLRMLQMPLEAEVPVQSLWAAP
jgi:hypothetical protein